MKIGDRCFVHGYIDEIRKDTVIIRNTGGYFGTDPGEVITVNDTAHPNWISLEDRFPDNNIDVLLQFSSNMGVGFYEDGDWAVNTGDGIYSAIGYNEEKPIAWMPLPEPYRRMTMRLIDADALAEKKYATTDSEIGIFPIKIGFNDIEKVINEQLID